MEDEVSDAGATIASGLFVLIIVGLFFFIFVQTDIDKTENYTYECSICNSTNISDKYSRAETFLAGNDYYFCYNCNKEYSYDLVRQIYKKQE